MRVALAAAGCTRRCAQRACCTSCSACARNTRSLCETIRSARVRLLVVALALGIASVPAIVAAAGATSTGLDLLQVAEYVVAFGTLLWATHAAYIESVQAVLKPLHFYRKRYEQFAKFTDSLAALEPDLFTRIHDGDDVAPPKVLLDRVRDDELHRAFSESSAPMLRLENLQSMVREKRDVDIHVLNPVRRRTIVGATDKTVHI